LADDRGKKERQSPYGAEARQLRRFIDNLGDRESNGSGGRGGKERKNRLYRVCYEEKRRRVCQGASNRIRKMELNLSRCTVVCDRCKGKARGVKRKKEDSESSPKRRKGGSDAARLRE